MANGLNVFSLNVRGLRNKKKRRIYFNTFKKKKYDIICLQETHITECVKDEWMREWKDGFVYQTGTPNSLGQVILFSKRVNAFTVIESNERYLATVVNIKNKQSVIINVYAPNGNNEKEHFFASIREKLKNLAFDEIILCGDFNCVIDNEIDIIAGEKHNRETVKTFNDMIDSSNIFDAWRLFHPNEKKFSWSTKNPFIARRLDYVFVSENIFDMVTECSLVSMPFSDHRGCFIHVKENEIIRGRGYWKFNNSLLSDPIYVNEINTFIEQYQGEYKDPQTDYEILKIKIKELTMAYSKQKSINRKHECAALYIELNDIDNHLSKFPHDVDAHAKKEHLKLKLELIEINKAKGAHVRARIKIVEEWEKNNKFFLGIEKARANSKIMEQVKDEQGNILTKQADIQNRQTRFFEDLYKKRINEQDMENKIDTFTEGCNVPKLSENQKETCELPLTENEILQGLKKMSNGSAPGSDGLTIEFYKFFWSRIKTFLIKCYQSSLEKGLMPISQRSAIITLIHKGKDLPRDEMKNWRPISLTNSDYKLLAKCLALRMNNVIDSIVNPDQVGYIKGRQSSTLLRMIDDVIDQTNTRNKPGLLATIDMYHAYDCISKEFMLKTFKKFGFGPNFISWVELLMKDTRSCTSYAGWLSSYFPVESGIRQGCPFSSSAFVLALEILAIKIRQSNQVKGINLGKLFNQDNLTDLLKIALYADDVTLFLADEQDLANALSIFRAFKDVSGLSLNVSKCEAMWLGSFKNRQDYYYDFNWKTKIKILGVFFSNNTPASKIEENYTNRIAKIKRLIAIWEKRDLSIMGKILIVKTYLLSQLVYFMQAFIVPEKILIEINRLLFRFIWKKKNNNKKAFEKVKRTIMCADYSFGGLKMIDVIQMQKAFVLQWVPRLSSSKSEHNWAKIPRLIFSSHGRNLECLYSNISSKRFKGLRFIKSLFWTEVLIAFLDNNDHSLNPEFNPMIWNNTNFLYNGSVLFFSEWAKKGIIKIQDLLANDSCISYESIIEILGNSPARPLEYITVSSVVNAFIRKNRDISNNSNYLANTPIFRGKKITQARDFRKALNSQNNPVPCSVNFWKRKFNYKVTESDWKTAFVTTKETRLRVLQWKLLHNIYPTNIMLSKMRITDNNYCSYCHGIVDYIEHFFFFCPNTREFWKQIENYILGKHHIHLQLDITCILFGIQNLNIFPTENKHAINNIILIGKMCISIFKKTKKHASLFHLFEKEFQIRESNR